MVCCYLELAVSSLAVPEVIHANTCCTFPRRDGQAELASVADYGGTCLPTQRWIPCINCALHRVTVLIETNVQTKLWWANAKYPSQISSLFLVVMVAVDVTELQPELHSISQPQVL